MSIDNQKHLLRTDYKAIRKRLITEGKKSILDGRVFDNLVQSVDFNAYRAVLCYVSFGIEVDTLRLISHFRECRVPIYAPKCYKVDSTMRFFAIDNLDSLTYGEYKGILEPKEDTSTELVDFTDCLCIVPALAFDRQGYRLGWGGGYYDRFLTKAKVSTVGLCYDACIAETLPKDCYDTSVSLVVTENNIISCGGINEY